MKPDASFDDYANLRMGYRVGSYKMH